MNKPILSVVLYGLSITVIAALLVFLYFAWREPIPGFDGFGRRIVATPFYASFFWLQGSEWVGMRWFFVDLAVKMAGIGVGGWLWMLADRVDSKRR